MTVDNITTTGMPFTVVAVDGAAAGGPHTCKITVYTDSSRSSVLYSVDRVLSKGKIKIN